MHDGVTTFGPGALALIAQGIVEEIAQPSREKLEALNTARQSNYRDNTMKTVPVEVRRITSDLGLANCSQSYAFVQRMLDNEARITHLEVMDRVREGHLDRMVERVAELEKRLR